MKLLTTLLFSSFIAGSALSANLKDICENAYYATGYTKLKQYKVRADKEVFSSFSVDEFKENIEKSGVFKVLKTTPISNGIVFYTIKEVSDSYLTVVAELKYLQNMDNVAVDCKYDI